jgi:hypothetical protein
MAPPRWLPSVGVLLAASTVIVTLPLPPETPVAKSVPDGP